MTRYALYTLFGLTALAGAFAAGRYTVPTRVEVHTEYLDRVREVRTTVIARVVDTRIKRIIEVRPDGSSKTEEHIDTHEDTRSSENAKVDKDSETKSVTIKSSAREEWQVYLVGGSVVPTPWSPATRASLTFGVQVNRRLFGPIWADVFILSHGAVGGGIGLAF